MSKKSLTILFFSIFSNAAFAAGGIQKVNTFMDIIAATLSAIAVVTVTIAIMWSGYKLLFKGDPVMECGKILGGGLFIGCSAQIAAVLVG
jgi:type IV secretion system protein VirB2